MSCFAGDSETAKQVIISILHHVSNSHVFPSLPLFSKCGHGPIEQEKEWIKPGSQLFYIAGDFKQLTLVINNVRKQISCLVKSLLSDLKNSDAQSALSFVTVQIRLLTMRRILLLIN